MWWMWWIRQTLVEQKQKITKVSNTKIYTLSYHILNNTTHISFFKLYLTYLQENFKPVVYRSASVEVFDEEDAQVVHPGPSYWGCQGT